LRIIILVVLAFSVETAVDISEIGTGRTLFGNWYIRHWY